MNFSNIIIISFLTYYTVYLLRLFNKKNRNRIKNSNKELTNLRDKPFKTLQEQKDFLNIKFPKKDKFLFSWEWFFLLCLNIIFYIVIFQAYFYMFSVFDINLSFWITLIILFTLPFIMDFILNRYGLEKGDLRHILRIR